jgi:hypothetical protein
MGDDVSMYLGIGDVLVAICISEDACHFCHLHNAQRLGLALLLSFLYHFLKHCLHLRDVGYAGFVLITGSETCQKGLLDVLGLVIYQHQHTAEDFFLLTCG